MNTRPPLPGPPPSALLARLHRTKLRPFVIGAAGATAIWSLFSGIAFYRNIGPYNDNGAPKLATISIALGSLYMGVFVIGLFGVCAAIAQKFLLIRIFAYLSALAVLIVVTINSLRLIFHFTMRDIILRACTNTATGQIYVYGGVWGPEQFDTLTPSEAKQFCNHAYERDTWRLVVGLLILFVIGVIFSIIAFSYLRQTLDPSSPANAMRNPQRWGGYPPHYPPPFSGPGYNAPYSQDPYSYPALGPTPHPLDTYGKPPDYEGWDNTQKKNDEESGERDVASAKTADRH